MMPASFLPPDYAATIRDDFAIFITLCRCHILLAPLPPTPAMHGHAADSYFRRFHSHFADDLLRRHFMLMPLSLRRH